jgi:nucleotide-binding universal stress UspA family protein
MKIVVSIDFSDCSEIAFKSAIEVLDQIDSTKLMSIILVHASDHQIKLTDRMKTWSKRFNSKYIIDHVQLILPLHAGIRQYLYDNDDIDLVVMGSHGISGKNEWFIGSNTQKVLRKNRISVLVVKSILKVESLKKAAFVTSGSKSDVDRFLRFINLFDIDEIHMLTIDQPSFFSEPSPIMIRAQEQFVEAAQNSELKCHFYPDYSVDAGVRHFSSEWDIDIVGISNVVRRPLKRFMQGSNVELIVNHLERPVISIDF